jgi:hypothetical protein
MKNLLLVLVLIISLVSCKKEPIDEYKNGGVLPSTSYSDDDSGKTLANTIWVLTAIDRPSTSKERPNDTIEFITEDTYVIYPHNDIINSYEFESVPLTTKYNFILENFKAFNGGNYRSQINPSCVDYWEITAAQFYDDENQNSLMATCWFERIK